MSAWSCWPILQIIVHQSINNISSPEATILQSPHVPPRPGLLGPVIRLLPHHHYSPSAIAKSHHIFPKSASGSHIPQCRGSLNKSLRKRRNYAKFWSKLHIPLQFVNSVMTFLALPLFQSFPDTAWVTQLISTSLS